MAQAKSQKPKSKSPTGSAAFSTHCLTLTMLLLFAQFEREATAERIRDKMAASKR